MNDMQLLLSQVLRRAGENAAKPCVVATRSHVERELRAYGEDAVATKLSSISDEDFIRIGERAFGYASIPTAKKSGGMLLAKALALAAVEVIEGAPRGLCRNRRVYT